jgi:hypothetical protein
MSATDRLRPGRLASVSLPALLATACIDTTVPAAPPIAFCIQHAPAAERPVVVVTADLGSLGFIECSGVLVSPKVVLTHLGCLVLPPDVYGEVPPEIEEPQSGSRSVFPNERDDVGFCANAPDWVLVEDGSFAGRFEEPVALSSLEVTRADDLEGLEAVRVRRVYVSGAASRCSDALGVLVLSSEITLGRPTLRLTHQTSVGEPVELLGLNSGGSSRIERVTRDQGDTATPPRAIALRHAACLSDVGGGVFSANGNALIGIIAMGATDACDDPAAEIIALQLSPFQNLLLAAADDARETLFVEPDPDAVELRLVPDCAAP